MQSKYKVVLTIVALAGATALGRYTAPEKVKIETKVVTVEKIVEKIVSETEKHKETKTVEVTKPDGTREVTTIVTEDTTRKRDKNTDSSTVTQVDQTKEVTHGDSKTTIAALAGVNVTTPSLPDYGISVSRPVIGPLTIGIFGFKSGLAGASVGLSF